MLLDMGMAMWKTQIPQTNGTGKACPEWGSEGWQRIHQVQVQMLTVCAENTHGSFLLQDGYGLKTPPQSLVLLRLVLFPCSSMHNNPVYL